MTIKKLSEIKPDKDQPRKTFDEEKLQLLAESILGNGLLKPIEIDENNIILDGERRYRACKIAKIKEVEVRIVKIKGNGAKRLRHQLIVDIQDEEIPTDERYNALVKLFQMEKKSFAGLSKKEFAKQIGIDDNVIYSAFDFMEFAKEEPELAKQVSPRVIIDTKSLPKEERIELIKEFKDIPKEEKKTELMRHLVKEKKEKLQTKKQLEELKKKNKEIQESKKWEIKVTTTKDVLDDIKQGIISTHKELSALMGRVRRIRKTKFYLYKPKEKDNFIRFLDGASERARKWANELDDLKETIDLEIVKE